MPQFTKQPPKIADDIVQLAYPAEHILYIRMNRPKAFNAMNNALNTALEDVLNWFESEPTLWVAVLGSTSPKAWCAGMDLKQVVSVGQVLRVHLIQVVWDVRPPGVLRRP